MAASSPHNAAFVVAIAVWAIASYGMGSEISLTSSDGVVLLRNGYVLRGHVTPLGDHYLITSGESDQIRIPQGRVALVCRNLEEAYLHQRDRCAAADVRAHLKLATWCLQYDLSSRAADQILAVMALDPGHPQLPALENRLRSSEASDRGVEPAAAEIRVDSEERSEEMVDQLPSDSIQRFTTTIQPLLMNRCGSYGCHGSGARNDLRLHRPGFGELMTRRITQRNLSAVMEQVDPQQPAASPLLRFPTAPHGGDNEPVFGSWDGEQYQTILQWIRSLRGHRGGAPESVTQPQPLLQTNDAAQTEATATDAAFKPRDPFDPEIFHRRHGLAKENLE